MSREEMLVKLTIEHGCIPVTAQARETHLVGYLADLRRYDPNAEDVARRAIRGYLDVHPEGVSAAWMACTGVADEWYPDFEPLYYALEAIAVTPEDAHAEAGKFLGLLLWNEMLAHPGRWHFNQYKKEEEDYSVKRYWAAEHICAGVKTRQAREARSHGDEQRAERLEDAAAALQSHWGRR
jgi:hypothetical protein